MKTVSKIERDADGTLGAVPTEPATGEAAIRMLIDDAKAAPSASRRTRKKVLAAEDRDDAALEADAMRRRVKRGQRAT